MAKLTVRAGAQAGAEFMLKGEHTIMGRRSMCAVPITDIKASREHAVIFEKGGDFFLQDLSRNGTLLNDRPANKNPEGSKLKFGDKIKIGDTVLELVDEKAEPINIDIPGYKIEEKIGSGGMGAVYKARQLSMDRIVALKVLNERYSANNEFVDRFIREARAAGRLNHPNVIHVHDVSKANGRHYFSMEYIDGASVRELLRKEKRIDVNKALDIILQAARALEFAHENHIVHRDIKPDNIMLTKEGIVKLADLGIAKTFDEAIPSAKEPRRVMGTPHYMAPEQAQGKVIDHRVDIYSLGATFYHIVTGVTPFSGHTAQEILKAHVNSSLPPIQDHNAAVPDPVCFIIERMLAKLPEKRYPSMAALITDIEKVQSGSVKGIQRIEATDSSVEQAVSRPPAKGSRASAPAAQALKTPKEPKEPKERSVTSEASTGVQRAISKLVMPLTLLIVFIVTIAVVVGFSGGFSSFFSTLGSRSNQVGTGNSGSGGGGGSSGSRPASKSNPEAQKLLDAAHVARSGHDNAAYVENLWQIRNKYPDSSQADEAAKLLDEFSKEKLETERKAAEALLSDAQKFESQNPNDTPANIANYKKALDAAGNVTKVREIAQNSIERFQKRIADQQSKALEAVYNELSDRVGAMRAGSDFDAARRTLNDFIARNASSPVKGQAEKLLEKINAEAEARYQGSLNAAAPLEPPAAIKEWEGYLAGVKDSTKTETAKAELKKVEDKAEQLALTELTKAADLAKQNKYKEAIAIAHGIQLRLAGLPVAEIAKMKEESLKRQKDLYEKILAEATARVSSGSVKVPFQISSASAWGKVDWVLSAVRSEIFSFDSTGKTAPGLNKRLAELTPQEQYQLILIFLPSAKDMSAEQHKAVAAFAAERGLTAEADLHEQMAGPK